MRFAKLESIDALEALEFMKDRPIDVERAAIFLIRKFGDDSAIVAYQRARCCQCRGDAETAKEWDAVLKRVVDLFFVERTGRLN